MGTVPVLVMLKQYDHIYLAPHLDDVVLSCGGQICELTGAGETVLIVSITAGDPPLEALPPFAAAHHESWQLDHNAVADRRAEDRAACALLGADWAHLTVRDAIYRRDPVSGEALYNNDVQLFGPVNSAETPLITTIANKLRALPTATRVISPLAVGNHVDHQLTREAAEAAFGDALTYYEDYPYVQRHGLGNRVDGAWASDTLSVSAEALATKLDAIAAYESQVEHLFTSSAEMRQLVSDYVKQVSGERLWRKK